MCPTDDNNDDEDEEDNIVYLTNKENEMRRANPVEWYSIENAESPFFTEASLVPDDISDKSLSEINFYNFVNKYIGSVF